MGNNKIIQGIKNEGKSFFQAVGKTSEPVYLVLLTLYVALFYFLNPHRRWQGMAQGKRLCPTSGVMVGNKFNYPCTLLPTFAHVL